MMKRLARALAALLFSTALAFAGSGSRDSNYNNTTSAAPPVGMTTPVMGSYTTSASGTTTFNIAAIGSSNVFTGGSTTNRKIPIPISGNLFGLSANLNTALTTASVTDLHNGSLGTVGCNFSAGINCNSGVALEHFTAGDFLEWQTNPGGGTWNQAGSPTLAISWLFQADTGANSSFILSAPVNANYNGASLHVYQQFGAAYNSAVNATELNASSLMPAAGSISGMYVTPNATESATNNHSYTLNKNGVNTGITCSGALNTSTGCCVNVGGVGAISGGPNCTSITAVTIAVGDTISLDTACPSAACNGVDPGVSLIWNPTTAGQAIFQVGNATTFASPAFAGFADNTNSTTQNAVWQIVPNLASTMTLSNLIFCVGVAPTGVTSRTATLQYSATPVIPATNSPLTTTFSSATPCPGANSGVMLGGSQDTTHTIAVSAGYGVDHTFTISGAPPNPTFFKTAVVATVP